MNKAVIAVCSILLVFFTASAFAKKPNPTSLAKDRDYLYLMPITYGEYALEPKELVLGGMRRYGWSVFSETDVSVLAHLFYKGEEMFVDIRFEDGLLTLKPVPPKEKRSRSAQSNVYNWMVNLRKSVAKEFHVRAIAVATPNFEQKSKQVWESL